MKHATLLIFLLLLTTLCSATCKYGLPFITNYAERDYRVSNHNYDIVQDERGVMYFANEYGILEFDGSTWVMVSGAPNTSNIKSLAIDDNNRLYAGAQGDVGYLDYNSKKGIFFHSLLDKIPELYRDFDNVWDIIKDKHRVLFRTWSTLFVYDKDTVEVIKTHGKIKGLFKVNDQIVVQDAQGLSLLKGKGLAQLHNDRVLMEDNVMFVLPYDTHTWLVGTHKNGLFLLKGKELKPFVVNDKVNWRERKISCGVLTKDGDYIIGTKANGIYFINKEGKVEQQVSRKEGLQSNEIRFIFRDRTNNIWVANKLGIDYVELSTSLRLVIPDAEDPIGIYASAHMGNELLFATHNGLLKYVQDKGDSCKYDCKRVKGSADINWDITPVNEGFVIGNEKGFAWYDGDELSTIFAGEGGWGVKQIVNKPGYWVGGTYKGLVIFKEVNGKLVFCNRVAGFDESSRVIQVDKDGNIWVTHGYKGIFKIELSTHFKEATHVSFYNQSNGLPSDLYNNVFKVWNEIVFGTQKGVYKYNAVNDTMLIHQQFTHLLGEGHVKKMACDQVGNVWFITASHCGLMMKHADGSYEVNTVPFNKLMNLYIPGFENFSFAANGDALVGIKNGAIVYDHSSQYFKHPNFNALLRQVVSLNNMTSVYDDHHEFLCDTAIGKHITLPFASNSLRFVFASNFYENIDEIKYKYFLQGYDDDWSVWQDVGYKEYTNLHEGDYVFRVKAINVFGDTSDEVTYRFSIAPPIHRTMYAYALYFFVLSLLLALLLRIRNVKVKKEKICYVREQERMRELEQAHFVEENLKSELKVKTKELSELAMNVIYRNEKLSELQEKVASVMGIASDKVSEKLAHVLSFIDSELGDDNWDDFEVRFDLAHDDFINKLKIDYPILTSKDLKICAYLKMNLSSKEIAQLLNMTVRGVENARYRVRKRLELDSTVNLTEWILLRK